VHQLLGRRVRSGSGGEERRRLLVPGSEQFSHCFMMASQDSLGTWHLSALPYDVHPFLRDRGTEMLSALGVPDSGGQRARIRVEQRHRG